MKKTFDVKRLTTLALLTTIALTIFVVESAIPTLVPIPGVKLGLANIVTLFVLKRYKFSDAAIVFAIVLTLASVIFCRRILIIMNTPADIIDHAYNYIVVIFIGIPTVFLYNMVSGVIRSLGDSKTPVVFLVLSSIINVVLDFFLILVCKMGVAGAGWATVTSQLISGLTCLIYMYKKYDILKGDKSERVLDRRFITNLCMNGVPMGLQYSITAIGSTILQAAVNTLGSTYVAAMTAGSKMFNFTCCPFDALGSTMATYAGQNVGAAKIKRLGQGVRSAMIIGSVYSVLSLIALYFTTDYIALLFVNASETTIIALTRQFILASACFYIPLTGVNVVRFCIQGMVAQGDPIVIWNTIDMRQPYESKTFVFNGKEYTWMSPEHCVVITGYDLNKNIVYIMDPMEGNVTRNLETFQSRYEAMHSQAVYIIE